MSIMTDRCKGLENAVGVVCPEAQHVFCTVHLVRNIASHCGSEGVKETVYRAADAPLRSEHDSALQALKEINPSAFAYLSKLDPRLWAQSHSDIPRFFITTSNAVESLNGVLIRERAQGPLKVFVGLYDWIFAKFGERRAISDASVQPLTVRATETLHEAAMAGKSCRVLVNGTQAAVRDPNFKTFAVSLATQPACSCRSFKMLGLPCAHIMAAFAETQRTDVVEIVHRCWLVSTQRELYSFQLPAVATHTLEIDSTSAPLFAPNGSRRKKRLPSKGEHALPAQRHYKRKTLAGDRVGLEEKQAGRAASILIVPGAVQPLGGGHAIVQRPGAQAHAIDIGSGTCDCGAFKHSGQCIHLRVASLAPQLHAPPPPEIVSTASLFHHSF